MGKISFDQINSEKQTVNRKPYFSLKEDGDFAIVRFMHKSVEDFDLNEVHACSITTSTGKTFDTKVSCLRDTGNCPLCAAGNAVKQRMYVHLVEYNEVDGKIVGTAKVWEKPSGFAKELKGKLDLYGDLTQKIFVITRHGAPRDQQTRYSIDCVDSPRYPAEKYPIIENAFDGFDVIGTAVEVKTADEMKAYIETGSFPFNKKAAEAKSAVTINNVPADVVAEVTSQMPTIVNDDDIPF